VNDVLYRGGQPKPDGYEILISKGIKSIVCLRGNYTGIEREKKWAADNGVAFYHIPLSVYKEPTQEQALFFLETVLNKNNYPVFVHCANGRDRTGEMIAFFRVVVDGWTIKNAYKEARGYGFFPYRGEEAEMKRFIHQLKDKPVYFRKAKELRDAEP
jgi:protein tyrosine/serine phosphatase